MLGLSHFLFQLLWCGWRGKVTWYKQQRIEGNDEPSQAWCQSWPPCFCCYVTHSSGWELLSSYRLSVQRNELISPLGCHENFPKEIGKAHKYSRTYNEPNRDVTEWPAKNMTDEIWTWSERKNPMGLKFPWWGIKFPRKFNKRQTRVLCYASPRI